MGSLVPLPLTVGDSPKTSTLMVRGKETYKKQALRRGEARGLTESKHPDGEGQGDSTKTCISTVRGKDFYFRGKYWGLQLKKLPRPINFTIGQ